MLRGWKMKGYLRITVIFIVIFSLLTVSISVLGGSEESRIKLEFVSYINVKDEPQPGDYGWLSYCNNGQLNGGVIVRYDSQGRLGAVETQEVITIWLIVWIVPYYQVGDIPSLAKLKTLYVEIWADDNGINFYSPNSGYLGSKYYEEIDLGQGKGIFKEYPNMNDHRSFDTAYGFWLWLHADAGVSPENHTCYVKFKFDWLGYVLDQHGGYWTVGSTDWLVIYFKVYVYWY